MLLDVGIRDACFYWKYFCATISGRLVTANKAAPVERSPRGFEPSFWIYVCNLPWQVDDAQVFSEQGNVLDVKGGGV